MRSRLSVVLAFVLGGLLVGAATWYLLRPRLTEERVRAAVVTTLQEEAAEQFLVTGRLRFATTVRVENARTLLPGWLDLNLLGTTRATIRVPVTAHYGFDVAGIEASDVRWSEDGVVTVTVPPLALSAIEPELEGAEVQTEVGWARRHASSGQAAEAEALRLVRPAAREQAERHLATSRQPRANTTRALRILLTPVFQSLGVEDPAFRFEFGDASLESPPSL